MFKSKGKLIYDPKSEASKFRSWWMKVDVHPSILTYYRYWIKKELGLHLNLPIWKSHITVIRGEQPSKPWNWKKYEGQTVEFEYSPELCMSETYVWLKVKSKRLEEIRTELGLRPRPFVDFHITVGNTKNLTPKVAKSPGFQTFPWEHSSHFKL